MDVKEVVAEINKKIEEKIEEKAKELTRVVEYPTKENKKFSVSKCLRGIVFNEWEGGEIEKKALNESIDSDGGYLVSPEYSSELIDLLRDDFIFSKLGVKKYRASQAPVYFPKITNSASVEVVEEGADIPVSQLSFERVKLEPRKIAGMVPISRNLIKRGDPIVDRIVRSDLTSVIMDFVGKKFFEGSGSTGALRGVLNTPGVNEVNGGTLTIDELFEAKYHIEKNNGKPSAWVMHPRTLMKLSKLKDNNGQYLLQPSITHAVPMTLLGLPCITTSLISTDITEGTNNNCSYILLGDWSKSLLAQWGGIEITTSQHASYIDGGTVVSAFSRDEVLVRITIEVDFALKHPEAFCKITGITE